LAQPEPHRVTQLILRLGDGDPAVAEELLPLVYDELRGVAQRLFTREPHGHTLQPTALVHEAWLKLAGGDQAWETRSHFFSVAARAMRQVLTDHARARRADKRGGGRGGGEGWQKVTFDDNVVGKQQTYDLVDIDDALKRLGQANERHARVVELKLFAGLSLPEIAKMLNVTPRTIQLDWRSARAYLGHILEGAGS
jgi:RNA polymerase sigma factor (TIGR02999 family)